MEPAQFHVISSPIGPLWLGATAQGVCMVAFNGTPGTAGLRHLTRYGIAEPEPGESAILMEAAGQLAGYFAGERRAFSVPLDLRGTAFQLAVWRALLEIPLGTTCSYRAVAERIGRPQAVRAVGGAVGANPVAVIVPCHRVMGNDGTLTGFGGGLERKTALLALEGVRLCAG